MRQIYAKTSKKDPDKPAVINNRSSGSVIEEQSIRGDCPNQTILSSGSFVSPSGYYSSPDLKRCFFHPKMGGRPGQSLYGLSQPFFFLSKSVTDAD
ncbi:MAG TPA: hypothetical protein DDW85_02845 [Porphyromonadaceae bacterium]|nr:hypothetical protein [Porphyromonadaceae bacterium]